jgi:hypothetical protein
MCDVPSMAVFCRESIECCPGIAFTCFLNVYLQFLWPQWLLVWQSISCSTFATFLYFDLYIITTMIIISLQNVQTAVFCLVAAVDYCNYRRIWRIYYLKFYSEDGKRRDFQNVRNGNLETKIWILTIVETSVAYFLRNTAPTHPHGLTTQKTNSEPQISHLTSFKLHYRFQSRGIFISAISSILNGRINYYLPISKFLALFINSWLETAMCNTACPALLR